MAESVTRHAGITGPKDFKFLSCGLDSLDLSIYVKWRAEARSLFDELEQKKMEAAGQDAVLWRTTKLGPALVRAGGRAPLYRYRVVIPDYEFFISKQVEAKKAPNVQVSISSRLLWKIGAKRAANDAIALIQLLGGEVTRSWPTRCDMCADFLMDESIGFDVIRHGRVCRSSMMRPYLDGEKLETCYLGSPRAPIQCRIYDKGLEIQVNGTKFWFREVWGLDVINCVWRVEFQLRREFLKTFKVHSVDALLDGASSIWRYLTNEWLSLRVADDSNTTRRTVHPWWKAIQDCEGMIGPQSNIERELETDEVAAIDWYVSHIAGCLCGLAARLGLPNIHRAAEAMDNELRRYWDQHDWETEFAKRRLKLGRDPDRDQSRDDGEEEGGVLVPI